MFKGHFRAHRSRSALVWLRQVITEVTRTLAALAVAAALAGAAVSEPHLADPVPGSVRGGGRRSAGCEVCVHRRPEEMVLVHQASGHLVRRLLVWPQSF